MWRRGLRLTIRIGAVLLMTSILIGTSAQTLVAQGSWDRTGVRWIYSHRSPVLDGLVQIHEASFLPVVLLTPVALVGVGKLQGDPSLQRKGWRLALSGGITVSLTFALKYAIHRKRPFERLPDITPRSKAGNPSFPSGHAAGAFCVATFLTLESREKMWAAPLFLWAFIVAYGRIYQGVHYPSDVVAGALVGTAVSWGVHRWVFRTRTSPK